MLRIGICGDKKKNGEYLETLIKKWKVECRIFWFSSGEAVFQNKEEIDIWILHIEQMEESGLEYILKSAARKARTAEKEQPLVVKSGTVYHSVLKNDIVFAENNGRKIVLHLEDKTLEFYGKMGDLENELGENFFRCHRGYLVAMSKIEGYDTGSIYLKNGENVYLAKQKYGEFTEKYKHYIEEEKS